jgi:hypothetical protein
MFNIFTMESDHYRGAYTSLIKVLETPSVCLLSILRAMDLCSSSLSLSSDTIKCVQEQS